MKKIASIFFFLLMAFACREPFEPEIPQQNTSVLVVEGYLDSEGLESEIKLSRTVAINADTTLAPEIGAKITLFSEEGVAYPISETEPGLYLFSHNVPEDKNYRIQIELKNGEIYESLPMKPILTPPIIDAGFQRDEEGVEVFITTQGNENADDFLWTYEETWIYRPRIRVSYIYDTTLGTVRDRTEEENISLCFKSEVSSDILLETSSRFQEQVVFRKTISEIPQGDERIQDRYSILVSQKAIDADAVQFWETLKRNTEDIGSIFSPLPSLISGNIRAVGSSQTPVVGQISMGVIQQSRIFINLSEVAPWGYLDPNFNDCIIGEEAVMMEFYEQVFGSGSILPARPLMAGTTIVGYYPSFRRCSDCTLYASPIIPDFWE
ncbi:MAG TPA: DUF4249 domain-containing protein [Algoriphagus sp.]|nr:DUF4249 domain-containing protein [Algoriphagus sp.]